jgi:hypothetical protein
VPFAALQVTNPLYLWQLWRADARHARHCFSKHNNMMDDKVAALLKMPPPEYTIAGELVLISFAHSVQWCRLDGPMGEQRCCRLDVRPRQSSFQREPGNCIGTADIVCCNLGMAHAKGTVGVF